ncbi:MAG: type II secretion system F family protein [Candidatus Omnitrophica bacterium]|nr:type II secretion system F family protein [Candidatus Omnitrophota bacterium]
MNTYKYSAKDKSSKTISGIMEAESESAVMEALHRKDLVVVSIEETQDKLVKVAAKDKKVKLDDLVIFSRQLATMIDAGIPLVHSLAILSEQIENKELKGVVVSIRQDIEAGSNFCDALNKHPKVFSDLFINMVRAGEASGMLDEVLERLAAYLEKTSALVRKIKASMVYPIGVVIMSVLITTILLLKVVPTFKGIFDILGGELPLPTVILIGVSDALRKYFIFIVAFLIALSFSFKKYVVTENGRRRFDLFKLRMPILGVIFRKMAVAKFSRTFATLVKSGVPILNALDIVSRTSGNKVIEEAVLDCSKSVRDGEPIARPLSKSTVFPPMVCRMISVGEQTGKLELMLTKIADFYEEQVDAAAQALTSLIEPLVIAFLGIVIGGIVISLFLPIFKITQLISG